MCRPEPFRLVLQYSERGGEYILNGGHAEYGIVSNTPLGGVDVESGGVDYKETVASGGIEGVVSGGISYATTILLDGRQTVYSGGVASGAQVYGEQYVSGGNSEAASLFSGGGLTLIDGGRSEAAVIVSGGGEIVYSGSTASNTHIDGGILAVEKDGIVNNPILAGSGGTLELDAGVTQIVGSVNFAAGGAILQIDTKTMPTAVISGFAPTDQINFTAVKYSNADTISVSGNVVTLITPYGSFDLTIANASNDTFEVLSGTPGTILETTTTAALHSQPQMLMIAPSSEESVVSGSAVSNASWGAEWNWHTMGGSPEPFAPDDRPTPGSSGALLPGGLGGSVELLQTPDVHQTSMALPSDR